VNLHLFDADPGPDLNFHVDADPDPHPDPDWQRNDANPHVVPTQFYTCWQIRIFIFTFSHSIASLQCFVFPFYSCVIFTSFFIKILFFFQSELTIQMS